VVTTVASAWCSGPWLILAASASAAVAEAGDSRASEASRHKLFEPSGEARF